jgi:hypothetical protein
MSASVKLILAAEKIVSQSGITHLKSLDVAKEAGVKNQDAINFHFGGIGGLVAAVFYYRSTEVDRFRESALRHLRDELGQSDLEIADWCFILLAPLAWIMEKEAPNSYHSAFIAFMHLEDPDILFTYAGMDMNSASKVAMEAIFALMVKQLKFEDAIAVGQIGHDTAIPFLAMMEKRINKEVKISGLTTDECRDALRSRLVDGLNFYVKYAIGGILKDKYAPINESLNLKVYSKVSDEMGSPQWVVPSREVLD